MSLSRSLPTYIISASLTWWLMINISFIPTTPIATPSLLQPITAFLHSCSGLYTIAALVLQPFCKVLTLKNLVLPSFNTLSTLATASTLAYMSSHPCFFIHRTISLPAMPSPSYWSRCSKTPISKPSKLQWSRTTSQRYIRSIGQKTSIPLAFTHGQCFHCHQSSRHFKVMLECRNMITDRAAKWILAIVSHTAPTSQDVTLIDWIILSKWAGYFSSECSQMSPYCL